MRVLIYECTEFIVQYWITCLLHNQQGTRGETWRGTESAKNESAIMRQTQLPYYSATNKDSDGSCHDAHSSYYAYSVLFWLQLTFPSTVSLWEDHDLVNQDTFAKCRVKLISHSIMEHIHPNNPKCHLHKLTASPCDSNKEDNPSQSCGMLTLENMQWRFPARIYHSTSRHLLQLMLFVAFHADLRLHEETTRSITFQHQIGLYHDPSRYT